MGNPAAVVEHLSILKQGVPVWNQWRRDHPDVTPDLSGAQLIGHELAGVNLSAQYEPYRLFSGDVDIPLLGEVSTINVGPVDILLPAHRVILRGANLNRANLSDADIRGADLRLSSMIATNFSRANLSDCYVYGVAAWDLILDDTLQRDLVIDDNDGYGLTTDRIEMAQFLHLLVRNPNSRTIIDTITSKVVLILGRFTPERKVILDAIRDELRKRNYLPILFDFEKPLNRDVTETVSTLAHMARFVIADLSDPKSIPHELAHVVPLLPSVPIIPLIVQPQKEYAMFEHFFGFKHVLKPLRYRDEAHLLAMLHDKVIAPAEKLALRVAGKRG